MDKEELDEINKHMNAFKAEMDEVWKEMFGLPKDFSYRFNGFEDRYRGLADEK